MCQTTLNPRRAVTELRELQKLTGDENGAQRVAWTPVWTRARQWLLGQLKDLPVTTETDEAGNLWITLRGQSPLELLIGGHLDSVPNGGWLDGSLNVVAGLEVLRRIASEGVPPVTIRLVDWADEEGARFGRSLFGSSCASGTIDLEPLTSLKDRDGTSLPEALAEFGISLDTVRRANTQLRNARAYLELHIEQGPVLEDMNQSLATVQGAVGIVRHAITFTGQSAHAGTTPMNRRRDALAAAAKLSLKIREIAVAHSGVCTVGSVVTKPGISSAVVGRCEILLEQRHLDEARLAAMVQEAREASDRFSADENVTSEWKHIWTIQPILFNSELLDLADAAVKEVSGVTHRMPSGALHDACEAARAGIPTVMMFVKSLRGLSHTKEEDTPEVDLEQSVRALDALASKAMEWVLSDQTGSERGGHGA